MSSGSAPRAIRAKAATTKASKNKNNTTDKWVGKKVRVGPGDLVKYHTANPHMMGGMGIVVGYLEKNVVLVKTFGGLDDDFPPMFISVRNQKPNDQYQNKSGENFQSHYQTYITSVAFRINPKPPKKRKPVQFHEVSHDDLPAVLTGEQPIPDGHKVVLVPPATP